MLMLVSNIKGMGTGDNDDDGHVDNHDDGKDDDVDDCDIDDDGEIAKLVRLCRQCASYEEQLCFQSHRGY